MLQLWEENQVALIKAQGEALGWSLEEIEDRKRAVAVFRRYGSGRKLSHASVNLSDDRTLALLVQFMGSEGDGAINYTLMLKRLCRTVAEELHLAEDMLEVINVALHYYGVGGYMRAHADSQSDFDVRAVQRATESGASSILTWQLLGFPDEPLNVHIASGGIYFASDRILQKQYTNMVHSVSPVPERTYSLVVDFIFRRP
jgi:hypothetical protein